MVCEDPQVDVDLGVVAVAAARQRLGRGHHRPQLVGVEDGAGGVHGGQDAFKSGAGVDVPPRQVDERAVRLPVGLHEHEVPDLDVALLAALGRAAARTPLGALVIPDLGAGPARPGGALLHLPEVVLAHPLHSFGGEADHVAPDLDGFVVVHVHAGPQPVGVEAEHLGHQVPRVGDGGFLEVVAEAEVAQHLEERDVPGGGADDLDVAGAEALLHARGPRPGRRLLAQEDGDELVHPRVGQQRRGRVVRDQAGRRDRRVAAVDEELGEGPAQVVGIHLRRSA